MISSWGGKVGAACEARVFEEEGVGGYALEKDANFQEEDGAFGGEGKEDIF